MTKLKVHYQTIKTDVLFKISYNEDKSRYFYFLHDVLGVKYIEAYYNKNGIRCKTTPTQFLYLKYDTKTRTG